MHLTHHFHLASSTGWIIRRVRVGLGKARAPGKRRAATACQCVAHTSSGQDPGTAPTSRRRAPAVPLEHRPVALAPRGPPAWCTQVNTTQTRGNVSKRLASTGRNRLKPQARPSPLSAPTPHPRPHLVTHGLVAHFQEQRGGLGRRVTQQRRVGKPTKALWSLDSEPFD